MFTGWCGNCFGARVTDIEIAAWREKAKGEVCVRLCGGPGDGQVFYFLEPPSEITYGLEFGRYLRIPTDGAVVDYRFLRHDAPRSDAAGPDPFDDNGIVAS
jgi:hypothetical protein